MKYQKTTVTQSSYAVVTDEGVTLDGLIYRTRYGWTAGRIETIDGNKVLQGYDTSATRGEAASMLRRLNEVGFCMQAP